MSNRLIEAIDAWLEGHKRPAWRPTTVEQDRPATVSKFFGTPSLRHDEQWPECGECGEPMPLLLQLNLSELPNDLNQRFGTGIIQLFYCCNSEECFHDGSPFVPWHLVRIVPMNEVHTPSNDMPSFSDDFTAKTITGWSKVDDYPERLDMARLGVREEMVHGTRMTILESDNPTLSGRMSCDDFMELEKGLAGDKLYGWPSWAQPWYEHYPKCPQCDEPMLTHVFQLEGDDNLPYIWENAPDARGHILQCPTHQSVLTFMWDAG